MPRRRSCNKRCKAWSGGRTALHERPLFDPALISANRYGELFQRFVADSSASSTPQAVADSLRKRLIPARDRFEADLEELIARRQQQLAELHASTRDLPARAVPLMIGICVFGLIASVMLTRLVTAPPTESSARGPRKAATRICYRVAVA